MVSKLLDFFNINGDEELTASDIAAKFNVGTSSVHTNLFKAIEAGLVVRKKNEDGEYVYTHASNVAGASRSPWPGVPGKSATPLAAVVPKVRRQFAAATALDLSALELEQDVPLSTARPQLDWPGLFNRMKPGQSCVLPRITYAACAKAMTEYKKAAHGELKRKVISDEQFRLWRLV